MEKSFMTSGQAANMLGISQDTLSRWNVQGILKPHHVSLHGYKYYSQEQIEKFLESYYGKYDEAQLLKIETAEPAVVEITPEESAKNEGIETIDVTDVTDVSVVSEGGDKKSEDDSEERERQGKGIVAQYHFFSTSRLMRELKNISLNELVTVPLGKAGSVDVVMWIDKSLQIKLMPTAFYTPEDELKPTEYDVFIIESVFSLKKAGNKEFTAAQLVKHMHGNSEGGISDEEIQFVEERIKTMMTWFIRIEMSDELSHYKYLREELKGVSAFQAHLLDTVILERKDKNGKTRTSFGFPINGCFGIPEDKEVAMVIETYSELSKQVSCFPTSLLNIPKIKSSRMIRILTNYLVKKIQGLKGNRKGIETILFSTIEEDLYMKNYTAKRMSIVRKCIMTIIQNCKEQGQIQDYELIMEGKQYKSIKIKWEATKKNARNGVKRSNKVHTRKSASVSDSNG